MKPWPEEMKQVLRHLAAARYFLPVVVQQPSDDTETQYQEFLHHTEFGLALDYLEDIGLSNRGLAEEEMFWTEMLCAAELMGRAEDSARFRTLIEESRVR